MTSIEEQARVEAERMAAKMWEAWTGAEGDLLRGATISGYLAGHEVATRTREVSTVAELDALPVGSVVLTTDGSAWQAFVRPGQTVWRSHAWPGNWASADLAEYGGGLLPARVLYVPEGSTRPQEATGG